MALTWASKVNGILTVVAIGLAVIIDLWDILDIKKGHSMVSKYQSPLPTSTNLVIGIFLEAFRRSGSRLHCAPALHLPLDLLCPSVHLDELWSWGYFHEPGVPGDSERQRVVA